jgi:hypothetical protein
VGKLELKKQEYSRLRKRRAGKQGRLAFCTDQGLLPVAEPLAELGYPVVTAEDASVNTSDDLAFLAWIREMGLVFVTTDWRRARKVWKDGLLHDLPGPSESKREETADSGLFDRLARRRAQGEDGTEKKR